MERLDLTPCESPEPDLSYTFKHIITREVAYNLMLFSQRRALHDAVAAWYERIRQRPSFKTAVEDWVTPADHERYAKEPDPWPKVCAILRAA